jgi:hypothetical protein
MQAEDRGRDRNGDDALVRFQAAEGAAERSEALRPCRLFVQGRDFPASWQQALRKLDATDAPGGRAKL